MKFERHLNNALVKFLLTRAQGNVNVAHYIYWFVILIEIASLLVFKTLHSVLLLNVSLSLITFYTRLLRDVIQEPEFAQRYSYVLGALLCLCGAGMRAEFEKQSCLVQLLGTLAENVRLSSSSSRQVR